MQILKFSLLLYVILSFCNGERPTLAFNATMEEQSMVEGMDTFGYTDFSPDGHDNTTYPCHLHPYNDHTYRHVAETVAEGTKLLIYEVNFPGYQRNPLQSDMDHHYQGMKWYKAFNSHGRTLVSLAFNYDVLSLTLLTIGVENLNVNVTDSPRGCFASLTPDEKIHAMIELVAIDFDVHTVEHAKLGSDPHVCHQMVEETSPGIGEFVFKCCRLKEGDSHVTDVIHRRIECTENKPSLWIDILLYLIAVVKFGFIIFGPLLLRNLLYKESVNQQDYVVQLSQPIKGKIKVKHGKKMIESEPKKPMLPRQFRTFRRSIAQVPPGEVKEVTFEKLNIRVDHRKLMSEKSVPVGLFHFLFEKIFQCGLRTWGPFQDCCRASMCGTWTGPFLCCNPQCAEHQGSASDKCLGWLTWKNLFMLLGGFLMMICLPIPYCIRLIIFYLYEWDEIKGRKIMLDNLGLEPLMDHYFLWYMNPSHDFELTIYCSYFISFIVLAAFYKLKPDQFDRIVLSPLQDMSNLNRTQCLHLFISHIVLPIEKFGICGFIIGPFYWIIALPVCLVISLVYCLPFLYLIGRYFLPYRPSWLRMCHSNKGHYEEVPTNDTTEIGKDKRLSGGTNNFETCLFLDRISPEKDEDFAINYVSCLYNGCKEKVMKNFLQWLVGIFCVMFMFCANFQFVEVAAFVVEVIVFTTMGAIINASSAAQFVMLSFWIFMYSNTCFKSMYEKYLKMNSKIFEYIKDKESVKNAVKNVTWRRHERQKNTAFKYFSDREIAFFKREEESINDIIAKKKAEKTSKRKQRKPINDTLVYICREKCINRGKKRCTCHGKQRLRWLVNDLVFFVDSNDVPRIPKKLFEQICNIEAPGCPGPVSRSLWLAFRNLSYMTIFLMFVMMVVMAFGDIYKVSSTNQLLLTLAGGFLPFVINNVIKPKQPVIELSTYSFEGKVHSIMRDYQQHWSAYDLKFIWKEDIELSEPPRIIYPTKPKEGLETVKTRKTGKTRYPHESGDGDEFERTDFIRDASNIVIVANMSGNDENQNVTDAEVIELHDISKNDQSAPIMHEQASEQRVTFSDDTRQADFDNSNNSNNTDPSSNNTETSEMYPDVDLFITINNISGHYDKNEYTQTDHVSQTSVDMAPEKDQGSLSSKRHSMISTETYETALDMLEDSETQTDDYINTYCYPQKLVSQKLNITLDMANGKVDVDNPTEKSSKRFTH